LSGLFNWSKELYLFPKLSSCHVINHAERR
jgi:hypothetical protein